VEGHEGRIEAVGPYADMAKMPDIALQAYLGSRSVA